MSGREIKCPIVNGLIKSLEDTLTALNAAQGDSIIYKLYSDERYRALSDRLKQTPSVNPEWEKITGEMQAIQNNLDTYLGLFGRI